MNAVDTNVLIYAHDPRDLVKQNKAVALVSNLPDGVLLWQVACEYIAASRKEIRAHAGIAPEVLWYTRKELQ